MSQVKQDIGLLIESIKANDGNISSACKAVGISRMTYYRLRKDHPELNNVSLEDDEILVSLARKSLKRALLADYFPAVRFVLETKGQFIRASKLEISADVKAPPPFDFSKLSDSALAELESIMIDDADDINTLGKYPHKILDAVNETETFLGIDTDFILPKNDREED